VARQVLSALWQANRFEGEAQPLPVSPSTGLLTDADGLLAMDEASAALALRRVADEESVRCLDDLVLRRANWAVTGTDPRRVRERVAGLLYLSLLPV